MHKQVWVKVNTPVDEGMAELISLLNQVNCLYTLQSCQGYDEWGYVYFRYGDWLKLGHFVFGKLAPILCDIEEITLCVETIDGCEPMAKLSFRVEAIRRITSALKCVL